MNIIKEDPTIWRLQTNTASADGRKISGYCLKNKILAMGWSLHDETIEKCSKNRVELLKRKRDNIKSEEDYEEIFREVFCDDYKNHISHFHFPIYYKYIGKILLCQVDLYVVMYFLV